MQQLSFFEPLSDSDISAECEGCDFKTLSTNELLDGFRTMRKREGASDHTTKRELSQLCSIARESELIGGPRELMDIFIELQVLADILCEPMGVISRSTNRTRFIAAQRFMSFICELRGRSAQEELGKLDSLLPSASPTGWHSAGTLLAGTMRRRRPPHPTLDAQDLHRILHAANRGGRKGTRNATIVTLHCFSGLRPEEIAALDWKQVEVSSEGAGYQALVATIRRNGQSWKLPLPRQSATALVKLAESFGSRFEELRGPMFKRSAVSDQALSYRTVREIVRQACQRAGLPAVEAVDLRAAFAHWLRAQGLSDHEVASVLGVQRVRTVDRLLRRHIALDAQRRVRETHLR